MFDELRDKDVRRFWSYVVIKNEDECWPWTGTITNGYGAIRIRGKKHGAHKIAYILGHNTTPKKEVIMHTCDYKICCNPKHLIDATHKENMEDSVSKGRKISKRIGEKGTPTKLEDTDILAIREIYSKRIMTLKQIGDLYGISYVMVHYIVKRKTWTHI